MEMLLSNIKSLKFKMRAFFFCVFIFSLQSYYTQQLRFFGEVKAGSSIFYQNKLLPFSENMDIVNLHSANALDVSFISTYSGKSFWHPGIKLGYFSNTYDIEFNGNSTYISELNVGNYNKEKPNSYAINMRKMNYYVISARNEFTVFNSKKINLNSYCDLGLNLVNRATNSQTKVNSSFTAIAEDEYNFYQNFKSHGVIEIGVTAETFRKRLGLTLAFKRNLTSVYNENGISKLSSFLIGVRYNFAKFNVSKYRYTKQKNAELKINNNSKILSVGIRLSYPITAKITTTGSHFYKSYTGNGEILVAKGNFNLERDFPILPSVYIGQKLSKYFEIELGLALRSYYMNIDVTKITPTSTSRDLVKGSAHLLYTCADLNTLTTLYQKKEHKIQLIAGLSLWKDFTTQNIGSLQNYSLGLQYKLNRMCFKTNYQSSFNKIEYATVGDLKLNRFSYLDLSIGYDIIQKQKKHRP